MGGKKAEANAPVIILSAIGLIIIVLLGIFIYLSVGGTNYTNLYEEKIKNAEIEKPKKIDELEGQVDYGEIEKELIKYVLILLKAYNLNKIPFTSDTPKIQIYTDNNAYFAEVVNGDIFVESEIIENSDIIIRTTYEEMFKMAENEEYIEESFGSEKSSIELVSSKPVLFAKGYLSLYEF